REAIAVFASAGASGRALVDAVELINYWALASGKSVEDAGRDMTKWLRDPAAAARDLTTTMHAFTAAELRQIETAQASGQTAEAQVMVLGRMRKSLAETGQQVSLLYYLFMQARTGLSNLHHGFMEWSGKKLSLIDETEEEKVDRLRQKLEGGWFFIDRDEVRRQLDEAVQAAEAAKLRVEARRINFKVETDRIAADEIVKGMDPAIGQAEKLRGNMEVLDRAMAAGGERTEKYARNLRVLARQYEEATKPAEAFSKEMERQADIAAKREVKTGLEDKRDADAWARIGILGEEAEASRRLAAARVSGSEIAALAAQRENTFAREVAGGTSQVLAAKIAAGEYAKGLADLEGGWAGYRREAKLAVEAARGLADAAGRGPGAERWAAVLAAVNAIADAQKRSIEL
ncbi:MAG: phage tail length tape measure family protein, partial [Rhodospirillales bacterium]|nr:phage tail length tape measure family protein [Rhodospirillales bacterium]